jgi:hypothetical protein
MLQDHTFKSHFFPISPVEAQAMVRFYRKRFCQGDLMQGDAAVLRGVERRLESHFIQQTDKRMFVRMSNRSPKDGIKKNGAEIGEFYRYKMEVQAQLRGYTIEDTNSKLVAFFWATTQQLQVTSASDTLNLLLSSERVFTDLILALVCAEEKGDEWRTSIVLREWNGGVQESMEFRAFCKAGRLTAISQYNHLCVYPELETQRDTIIRRVSSFWEEVKANITFQDYILDVGLLADGSCVAIELNPYARTTGAGLFDWNESVLESGPLELRLNSNLSENSNKWWEVICEPILEGKDDVPHFDCTLLAAEIAETQFQFRRCEQQKNCCLQ